MTEIVPKEEIEQIVGRPRMRLTHLARAVSREQTVYILHSERCLETYPDLRQCPFSVALDRGIDPDDWIEDRPVYLTIEDGWLTGRERA